MGQHATARDRAQKRILLVKLGARNSTTGGPTVQEDDAAAADDDDRMSESDFCGGHELNGITVISSRIIVFSIRHPDVRMAITHALTHACY